MPELLDFVELRVASGPWGPGTQGTVVHTLDNGLVVEILDAKGRTVDTLSLPYDAVKIIESSDPSVVHV